MSEMEKERINQPIFEGGNKTKPMRETTAREELHELMGIYAARYGALQALGRSLPGEMPYQAERAMRTSFKIERKILNDLIVRT